MKVSNLHNPTSFTSLNIGKLYKNSSKTVKKIINNIEPNGGDNTFYGLTGIMLGAVLLPRIITAAKRNPDNKEATKDEIKEILFRDVQTILIMLFGLKVLNAGVGNISTKITGIPMVEEPLNKVFNSSSKGLKAIKENTCEFVKHPIEKGKIILKNIGKIIHPTGGSILSTGNQINSRFTNYKNYAEIKTFLKSVPEYGGDSEKVFKKIIQSLIENQDKAIAKAKEEALCKGEKADILKQTKIKETLQQMLRKDGFTNFTEGETLDANIENLMKSFFDDKNNNLARSARNVKDWLRMLALGIEVLYLGFGLPALNQMRLKKKYLGEKPIGTTTNGVFNPINDKHVKAQEIKLYSQFIK